MMILSETSMLNYFLNQTLVGTMLFDSDLKKRREKIVRVYMVLNFSGIILSKIVFDFDFLKDFRQSMQQYLRLKYPGRV